MRRDAARVELEHRVRAPNKHVRFVRMRAWRSIDGRHLHALVEDTTQRSPITERLASVSAFAAGVAHEINNPLGFLSANLELIKTELDALERPAELETLLREARHGIHRIHTVVRGLMTFSRIEPTHREPLDLNRVLEVAIGIAHNEIRTRAKLVRHFKPLPLVEGNAAALGQVFVNLLLNAAQAITPGKQGDHTDHEITILTRTDAAANVVIEVHDTGRGIPRGVGAKVFEAFVTTSPPVRDPARALGVSQPRARRGWGHHVRERARQDRISGRVALDRSRSATGATEPRPDRFDATR